MIIKILAFLFLLTGFSCAANILAFTGKGYTTQNKTWDASIDTGYTIVDSYPLLGFTEKSSARFMFRGTDVTLQPWWSINISAAMGQELKPGLYTGVEYGTLPEKQFPLFSIAGDGRVDPRLGGTFTILEMKWNEAGTLSTSAAFDFNLWDSLGNHSVIGSLRYNSDIPVSPIPEPSTLSLLGLVLVARRKR